MGAGDALCGVCSAGALNVRAIYAATARVAANAPDADEQPPARRLAGRRVCDGRDCRAYLLALHHRTAQRHSALYRPERGSVARRRHVVPLRARHGPAVDSGYRFRQPAAAEKRPVDGAGQNRVRLCYPGAAGISAGARTGRAVGIASLERAWRRVLRLGVCDEPERHPILDARGANRPAGCGNDLRPSVAGLGFRRACRGIPGASGLHPHRHGGRSRPRAGAG
ncbi:hypothetical protein BN131_1950 [Cronobacter malonaticus 681]|nr:hypothetical protein BN131_1950 [Cronobacter malonaticus 681]